MEFYAFIWVGQYRLTGRELGEREGGGIGKGPQARTQTLDTQSAMAQILLKKNMYSNGSH